LQGLPGARAQVVIDERDDAGGIAPGRREVIGDRELAGDGRQVGARFFGPYTILQTPDDVQHPQAPEEGGSPFGAPAVRVQRWTDRCPELRTLREVERLRHDAHDREWTVGAGDAHAHNGRIARETPLP